MRLVDRKTRKGIRKALRKVIRSHGPEIVAGLASGVASMLMTLASTEAPGTKGRKSNLAKVREKMSNALAVANDKGPGTRVTKRKKRQRGEPKVFESSESALPQG